MTLARESAVSAIFEVVVGFWLPIKGVARPERR